LGEEEIKGIYTKEVLDEFAEKVRQHKEELIYLIHELKKRNKKVVGISAPHKANTILNYCKINDHHLEYMTEKSKLRIGQHTPGMHIPIVEEEKLLSDNADYGIIFAWNFAEEIIKNPINQEFSRRGGKFILPVPKAKIIDVTDNNNPFNADSTNNLMESLGVSVERIDPVHMDERGIISNLINENVNNVGLITTEEGAIRGSHYHKISFQYSYTLSGKFEVLLAHSNNLSDVKKVIVNAGEIIIIPPLVVHQFKAIERAVMINMGTLSREDKGYEDDTVRVDILVDN